MLGLLAAALATETRTAASAGAGALAARRAEDAAVAALHATLARWAESAHDTLAVGASTATAATSVDGVATTARVTRLGARTHAIHAEAVVRPPGAPMLARRARRLLVARDPLLATPTAAVTLGAALDADAATEIVGADTMPPGWRCDAADSASVAPLAHDPDRSRYAPPPSPAPPSFPAALPADALAPLGDVRLPLVHVRGDHALVGRAGQGTLVIDGDLTMTAGAELWGVVVVGGTLRVHGPVRVVGALLAAGRAGEQHVTRGLRVRWSSCVVAAALGAAGTVRPVTARALTAGR